jgi:hypothetical protein
MIFFFYFVGVEVSICSVYVSLQLVTDKSIMLRAKKELLETSQV